MWRHLCDYWLPWTLFAATLLVAIALALAVVVAPYLPFTYELIGLYASDAVVRRTSLAAAVGLTVTAFVFFRPKAPTPEPEPSKPPQNTMAGA